MGCFNGTCVITNLPIRVGEPTVLIPLAYRKNYRGNYNTLVYATDVAQPITFGIDGVYNDYGSIEDYDEKDIPAELITRATKVKSLDDFISNAFDDKLTIKLVGEETPVGFVLAHKKVYDFMLEQFGTEEDYNNADAACKMMLEFGKDKIDDVNALLKKYGGKLDKTIAQDMSIFNFASFRLGGFELGPYDIIISEYLRENTGCRKKKKENLVKKISSFHTQHMAFVRGMNYLRKSIAPPCGGGSQSSFLKAHMKLNNVISEIIASKVMDSDMNDEGMSYVYNVMLGDEDY